MSVNPDISTKPPHSGKANESGTRTTGFWFAATALVVVVGGTGLAAYYSFHHEASLPGTDGSPDGNSPGRIVATRVVVTRPRRGGLGRVVSQPATILAFDKAELYAKVSGYLTRQKVDIGDIVKKGDVLAEVDAPEYQRSRDQARAALDQARAKLKLSEAAVQTAEADRLAAAAMVTQAEAEITKLTAFRVYRKKERDRIADLVARQAVEQRLLDEQEDQLQSAIGGEQAGIAAVATARASLAAAIARIAQARAEVERSRSDIAAAEADLAKTQVFVDYTKIISPYDAVVTLRSFHNGDFIRSASDGGNIPVLSVASMDLMRVVMLVPDLDVPFVDRGDPVTIQVDALGGQIFRGVVARMANSENEQKLMRTEVDLPNKDNRLRDGMYGTGTIETVPPSNNLSIPSACLIEQTSQGEGAVYLVKEDKVHRQPVRDGADNGSEVEVLSGLQPEDQVIVRYSGSIAEGVAVQTEPTNESTRSPNPSATEKPS